MTTIHSVTTQIPYLFLNKHTASALEVNGNQKSIT